MVKHYRRVTDTEAHDDWDAHEHEALDAIIGHLEAPMRHEPSVMEYVVGALLFMLVVVFAAIAAGYLVAMWPTFWAGV